MFTQCSNQSNVTNDDDYSHPNISLYCSLRTILFLVQVRLRLLQAFVWVRKHTYFLIPEGKRAERRKVSEINVKVKVHVCSLRFGINTIFNQTLPPLV